ncbi:ribonuclease H-like domain-containing protein [Gongronella butleri]|nr:ribonuclease H-like domain-containing protein [Gongronella butleri]
MTGLDLSRDHIIEIAVLLTDENLNIIAEGPELVIHQEQHVMDGMDEWCTEHHGKSGLTSAVLASKVTTKDAQDQILEFLQSHYPASSWKGKIPLGGNSVHADKQFLQKEMPALVDYLHYRIIDVSTIKELVIRWYPAVAGSMKKLEKHRALDDIKESIAELQFYRDNVFISQDATSSRMS